MAKIEIKTHPHNEVTIIEMNGNKMVCPFQQKMMFPKPTLKGQEIQIQEPVCNSLCPFFERIETDKVNRVVLHCTGNPRVITQC